MLAVKAKHATMLLTVSDVEGVPEGLQEMDEEKSKKYSAQAFMVREHKKVFTSVGDNIAWHCLIKLLTHFAISGFNPRSSKKLILAKPNPIFLILLIKHLSLLHAFCMALQMTAGRCHTLLSPVTEESGEEGTSSEVSSSPVCRSPSPIAHADVTITKVSILSFLFYPLIAFFPQSFMSLKIRVFFLVRGLQKSVPKQNS